MLFFFLLLLIASLFDFNLIHTRIPQNGNFGSLSRGSGTLRSTLSGARSSWSGPHICPMNQERMRCILFHGREWPMGVGVRSKARALALIHSVLHRPAELPSAHRRGSAFSLSLSPRNNNFTGTTLAPSARSKGEKLWI